MNHNVPAYSQILDVKNKKWQRKSCGITSLKMTMDYHNQSATPNLDKLIQEGVEMGGYLDSVGWKHAQLAELAEKYELHGENYDWWELGPTDAFKKLKEIFPEIPVLASIYKKFDPNTESGHLIVLTGMEEDIIYYNEPEANKRKEIRQKISKDKFLGGWKRRIIVVEPK